MTIAYKNNFVNPTWILSSNICTWLCQRGQVWLAYGTVIPLMLGKRFKLPPGEAWGKGGRRRVCPHNDIVCSAITTLTVKFGEARSVSFWPFPLHFCWPFSLFMLWVLPWAYWHICMNVLWCTSKWIGRGTLPSASLSLCKSKAAMGLFLMKTWQATLFMYAPKVRFAAEVGMSGTKVPKVCTVCLLIYTHTHRVSNIRKQSLCWQNVGYEFKSWNGWNLHFAPHECGLCCWPKCVQTPLPI
jgi:hypothetical protein